MVEPLELKGKSERVPAYRLLSVGRVGIPERRHDLPLVGREEELAVLTGALEGAIADRACRLVTVIADAGTGQVPPARGADGARRPSAADGRSAGAASRTGAASPSGR